MDTINNNTIQEAMAQVLPDCKVLTGDEDLQFYGKDWTHFYPPKPLAIVFPKTVEQVQALVQWANAERIALVPSGGRTGLSGGAVASQGELVVAMDDMNRIGEFNAIDQTVQVEAGVITGQLQQFAEQQGLFYPVDFASAGSSQVGGNIATNAGGIKVIRYGMTRQWVKGLTVVTGEGHILRLNNGLLKNNTGYDLQQLFIGSEGTLGIIVEACIQLLPAPEERSVMVLGLGDLNSVFPVLQLFRSKMTLNALEFFSDKALKHVLAQGHVSRPFESDAAFYVLIEFDSAREETQTLALELFEQAVENAWCIDGVISQSDAQAAKLWRLREDISESIAGYKPYKNDISVTVSNVAVFLERIDALVSQHYPDFETVWFGHIGDGNLHLNVLKPDALPVDAFASACNTVSQLVFETIQTFKGSVSAEHGVGLLKKPYLGYTRSEEEIAYFKSIKKAFDPNGILNPGKIFDL